MKKGLEKILLRLPAWSLTIVCGALIIYLTLVPKPLGEMQVSLFPGADKAVHGIMFGGFALCLAIDIWRRSPLCVRTTIKSGERRAESGEKPLHRLGSIKILLAGGLSILFGGVIEIVQNAMHIGREGDVWDFVADCCGAILVTILLCIFDYIYGRKSR